MYFKNGYFQYQCSSEIKLDLSYSGVQYLNSSIILVCFTGAVANKNNKAYPFFSGAGLSKQLQVPCLSISDSSLLLSKNLNLAWYAGNVHQHAFQKEIARFIDEQIPKDYKVILIGGSGGGFASLAIATLLDRPADIFVWNPQTSITDYASPAVFRYISAAFPEVRDLRETTVVKRKRFFYELLTEYDIVHDLKKRKFSNNKRLIVFQNQSDNHLVEHCLPFLRAQGVTPNRERILYSNEKNFFYVGKWGYGHVAPDKNIILSVISYLANVSNKNLANIISLLPRLANNLETLPRNVFSIIDVDISCKEALDSCRFTINISAPLEVININDFSIAFYFYVNGIREKVKWYSHDAQWEVEIKKEYIQNVGFRVFFKDCFSNKSSKFFQA